MLLRCCVAALLRCCVAALLEGNLAGGRAAADLEAMPDSAFPAPVAQLLLVGAMLGGEALPRGGTVRLLPQGRGFAVQPEGRVVAWSPALDAALRGALVEGPRDVLSPLLTQLAAAARWESMLGEPRAAVPALLKARILIRPDVH
jgi:histidine phosphotransferase ChpT